MSFTGILRADEHEVMYHFLLSGAVGAFRRIALSYAEEVLVERNVTRAELDIDTGLTFWQVIDEFHELPGWHAWVYRFGTCVTRGLLPHLFPFFQ